MAPSKRSPGLDKDKWIENERKRWASAFSVPIASSVPDNFPSSTVGIMRCLCVLDQLDRETRQTRTCDALDALYHAYWVERKQINEPEVLKRVLEPALGANLATKVLELAPVQGKPLLIKNTDAAFADGAFGLPWFACVNVKGETARFWGVDHLGQVCHFLGIPQPKQGGWQSML